MSSYLRCLFLSFFLSCGVSGVLAQDSKPSSQELIAKLDKTDKDIERLELYTEIVKATWRKEPELAEQYGQQALTLHNNYQLHHQKATLIAYLTRVYIDRKDMPAAEKLTIEGVSEAKRVNAFRPLTLNLFNQALVYQIQDKLVLALNTYQDLATAYESNNYKDALGNVFNNIGNIRMKLGDLNGAFEYYQKALPLIQEGDDIGNYANTLMNIGRVFSFLQDYEQAEKNYFLGLSEITETNHPLSFVEGNQRLGNLYRSTRKFDDALKHYQVAERVAKEHQFTGILLRNYFEMMRLAVAAKNVDLKRSSMQNIEHMVTPNLSDELINSLHYFRALNFSELGQWQSADESIDTLFELKAFDSRFYALKDSLDLAFKIKTEVGKLDDAKLFMFDTINLYKKQQEQSNADLMAQYAQLYKTNQKEQQIQVLEEQTLRQKNELLIEQEQSRLIVFVFIVLIIVLVSASALFAQRNRNLARENELNAKLMDEKKQFFSDISHELRTPLTVFKLKMQELEYNLSKDPKQVYKLLYDRIDSFNHLINDISLLAQNDKGELVLNYELVELKPFFELRVEEIQSLARESGLEVETHIDLDSDSQFEFDPARVRQILCNLFCNACRYTSAPGKVVFSASVTEQGLIMVVEDTAPSVEKQQLTDIFTRLYRVESSRSRQTGGSGLGLSICQSLVEAHGGSITAEQSDLGGLKVTCRL